MNDLKNNEIYYSSERLEMIKYIPQDIKTILDIGCATGVFAALLRNKYNAEVWGVEINPSVANEAKGRINQVIVGDILENMSMIPNDYFDCITFNDVLEHMVSPEIVLAEIKNKLTSKGVLVCSIPNIRYIGALKKLLINKQWKYEDEGILDRTHLRFFTKKSIIEMFDRLNYEILKIEGINPTKQRIFLAINILTFGFFTDTKFTQFACVVRPK